MGRDDRNHPSRARVPVARRDLKKADDEIVDSTYRKWIRPMQLGEPGRGRGRPIAIRKAVR